MTGSALSVADFQPLISAFTDQISVVAVLGVLAAIVTAGIGFVFMWFGVRKLLRSLITAFQSGKLKV